MCIVRIMHALRLPHASIRHALFVYAVSGSLLTFSVRPFSNNVEAVALALSLLLTLVLRKLSISPQWTIRRWLSFSLALGVVVACGLFSRFTFLVFVLPSAAMYLHTVWTLRKTQGFQVLALFRLAAPAVAGFLTVSLAHIGYDTMYYASGQYVLAPWNAALYNSKSTNLQQHGRHPLWLHCVVNAPMVLGVGLYVALIFSFGDMIRPHASTENQIVREAKWREYKASSALI